MSVCICEMVGHQSAFLSICNTSNRQKENIAKVQFWYEYVYKPKCIHIKTDYLEPKLEPLILQSINNDAVDRLPSKHQCPDLS